MFRALALAAALWAAPAWAGTDVVATLNGLPITALQTYWSFKEQMTSAGWVPADEDVQCGTAEPIVCHAVWKSPSGKQVDVHIDYRNDANEFYLRPVQN